MDRLLITIYLSSLLFSLLLSELLWYVFVGGFINGSCLLYIFLGMMYDFILLLVTHKLIHPIIVKYVVNRSKYVRKTMHNDIYKIYP